MILNFNTLLKNFRKENMITQEMIDYYLGDDYSKWLPEILKDIFNNPKDFEIVKQEILEAWEQHLE